MSTRPNKTRDRLRIAVQKSGRLSEPSQNLLAQCGLSFRQSRDKLFCFGENQPVDLLLVRDDDIPGLIDDGVCDLGFLGRNVLEEARLDQFATKGASVLREVRALGFGGCRLSIAVPQEEDYGDAGQLAGRRIATSYPRLLSKFLADRGVDAGVVTLSGSVEIAPRLGTADLICDLVSSGATLVANQLKEAEIILKSEAILAGSTTAFGDERDDILTMLMRRLDGVLAVRETRMLMLRTTRSDWPAVRDALPLGSLPTLTRIDGEGIDVAVQAIVPRPVGWPELEAMSRAGARQMLVLPVERMLA
ncbi:MAG TPA: ATP phosphoribosyltransferase [Pseudomonadota bacterium]|nr:ATP phosphoribosyltransferase [Pseudomonadota bacterium]